MVVAFSFAVFRVAVGRQAGCLREVNAERSRTCLSALLPRREAWSPRVEVPERQVRGQASIGGEVTSCGEVVADDVGSRYS
jgi:hypothetical protein